MNDAFTKSKSEANYSVDNSILGEPMHSSSLPNFFAPDSFEVPKVLPWFKSCPFCGTMPTIDDGITYYEAKRIDDDEHIFGCGNEECSVQPSIVGENIDALIERWNKRK
jgi:hypothetical protein